MEDFLEYLEEVCCAYIGEMCFCAEEFKKEFSEVRDRLISLAHGYSVISNYSCRNSVELGRVFVVNRAIDMLKKENISRTELKESCGLDVSMFPNSKLIINQRGFLIKELCGAVIGDKVKVSPNLFENIEKYSMSTILADASGMLGEDVSEEGIESFIKRVNLQLLLFGYVNKINVGYIFEKIESFGSSLFDIYRSSGPRAMKLANYENIVTMLLCCIFDVPLTVFKYDNNLHGNIINEFNSDLENLNTQLASTQVRYLCDLFEVDDFDELLICLQEILRLLKDYSAKERNLDETEIFVKSEKAMNDLVKRDSQISELSDEVNRLTKELSILQDTISTKNGHISDLNKEISKLKARISCGDIVTDNKPSNTSESIDIFEDVQYGFEEQERVVLEYLNSHKVCIIGGPRKLTRILDNTFEEATIIEKEDSLDDGMLKFKEVIIINTVGNLHKHYDKVKSIRRKDQMLFIVCGPNYKRFIGDCYDYIYHLINN